MPQCVTVVALRFVLIYDNEIESGHLQLLNEMYVGSVILSQDFRRLSSGQRYKCHPTKTQETHALPSSVNAAKG